MTIIKSKLQHTAEEISKELPQRQILYRCNLCYKTNTKKERI
jgi:hypothetical protein